MVDPTQSMPLQESSGSTAAQLEVEGVNAGSTVSERSEFLPHLALHHWPLVVGEHRVVSERLHGTSTCA
jgi:hypothetical protein